MFSLRAPQTFQTLDSRVLEEVFSEDKQWLNKNGYCRAVYAGWSFAHASSSSCILFVCRSRSCNSLKSIAKVNARNFGTMSRANLTAVFTDRLRSLDPSLIDLVEKFKELGWTTLGLLRRWPELAEPR